MAQQTKKKSAAKKKSAGTAKKKKTAATRSSAPEPAQKKPLTEAQRNQRNTIWGIVLFAAALITFLSFIDNAMGPVGNGIHVALCCALGAASIGVPALFLILAGTRILRSRKSGESIFVRRAGWLIALYWCVTALWSIIAVPLEQMGFIDYLSRLAEKGKEMSGGGVISGFLAWPLLTLFGQVGAIVVAIVLILIFLVVVSGVTFATLFDHRPEDDPEDDGDDVAPEPVGPSIFSIFRRKKKPAAQPTESAAEPKKHSFVIPDLSPDEQLSPADKNRLKRQQQEREKELNAGFVSEDEPTKPAAPEQRKKDSIFGLFPASGGKKPAKANNFEFSGDMLDGKKKDVDELMKTPQQIADEAKALMEQEAALQKREEDAAMTKDELRRETAKVAVEAQKAAEKETPYVYPPLSLLNFKPDENAAHAREEMKQTAANLMQALKDFSVDTTYLDAVRGPTVTRYELQPNAGVKISKITRLADDIALHLAASGVRIEAPIPGRSAIGIEIPNKAASVVYLKETISSDAFRNHKSHIAVALGKDIAGQNVCIDLAKMPHLLIAGSTGSGKSVCINTILMSILYKSSPDQVKLILVDPKVVELSAYNGIPHLLIPVVTSAKQAAGALQWAVTEMLDRYNKFAKKNVRNYQGYNEKLDEGEKPMPQIVIVIDELADLMMAAPGEVEDAICRLAQMARAAGMHLIIATQRPSADVLTGLIKTNVPSRIAFAVSSQIDSRIILDQGGAEKLIGRGDMLYNPLGAPKPMRIQGCFVSDGEVENVVNFIKEHSGEQDAQAQSEILSAVEKLSNQASQKGKKGITGSLPGGVDEDGDYVDMGDDPLLPRAVEMVISQGMASTSGLQRSLGVGHSRAGRIMDQMEKKGYIGPYQGSKPREVLINQEQWNEIRTTQAEGTQDE